MKKTVFTRGLSLLCALVLMLSLAACGGKEETTTQAPETTTAVPETTTEAPETTTEAPESTDGEEPSNGDQPTGEATVSYLSLSVGADFNQYLYLTVYDNYDGTAYLEFETVNKKLAPAMDAAVLADITEALLATELLSLNGQDSYEEGQASGAMFVEMSDGSMYTYSFSGETVPTTFETGFYAMVDCLGVVMADVPVYTPAPTYMGEIDPALKEEIDLIINNSTLTGLDGFAISQLEMDEYFAAMAGLSSAEGIAAGLSCAPMMMTNAYSLVIVTLDGAEAADVAADFEQTMDWRKWVCVAPTDAMIAQKGNMVLCLMAGEGSYDETVNGITAAGWEVVKTLTNPDL